MSRPRKVRPYGDSNRSQIGEQYAGGISTLLCAWYIGSLPHELRWDSSGVVFFVDGSPASVKSIVSSTRTYRRGQSPAQATRHQLFPQRCRTSVARDGASPPGTSAVRVTCLLSIHCIHGSRPPTMTLSTSVRQSGRHLRYLSALYHSPTLGLLRPIIELPCDRSHTNIPFEHHTDSRSPLWLPSSLVCSTPTLTARSRSSTP